MSAVIHCGDVRDVLATLPAGSVQTCVTSPPYYALRDYGVAGQIGLESTIDEYIAAMVDVFRDVRRVLRDDGTLWLNIGDSYAGSGQGGGPGATSVFVTGHATGGPSPAKVAMGLGLRTPVSSGLAPKQLCMIPARLALALQEDGWWVRSEIIWAKPNPMPESVQDRPTVAHEHIWLLTKAARYYYDADAIRVPHKEPWRGKGEAEKNNWSANGQRGSHETVRQYNPMGANARTVWDIATQGWSGAHFATFPLEIPRRCILAGTSERGACPACGAPWRRVVERAASEPDLTQRSTAHYNTADRYGLANGGNGGFDVLAARMRAGENGTRTTGWQPTCRCDAGEPVPCVVLDPFSGSGTTGVVALRHARDYVGIELNSEYAEMSRRRIHGDAPLLNSVRIEAA